MKKLIKYTIIGVAGLLALILIIVTVVVITFNPNDYKQQVIDLVQSRKQRTLTLEGDIKLSFWPKIGANLGKVAISEHSSPKEFASVNNVKVALAILPLLKKELVVDTVYVDGAKANIVKFKDGTTNFDDLLSNDKEESQDIKFDVQGIQITNSEVKYTDEASKSQYSISRFNMESGHIALAEPVLLNTDFTINANKPFLAANVKLDGNFLVDPKAKHFGAKGLDAHVLGSVLTAKNVDITVSGDVDAKTESMEFLVDDLKLIATGEMDSAKLALNLNAPALHIDKDQVSSKKVAVSLSQIKADGNLKVNMELADMKGSPKAIQSSGITGDIAMVQGARNVTGKFSSPFNGNFESLIFDIPKLVGNLDIKDPSLPNGAMNGTFSLATHTDVKQELADAKFNVTLEDVKLNGDVDVASFKQPNIKFNLNADKLDLNQLLGKSKASTKTTNRSNPTDLSGLKRLRLDGRLAVGSIIYDQYHVSGLNLAVKADGEKLAISGLNVKLDDSQIKGNFSISQFAKPLYSFDIDIDEVNVDKYLKIPATQETKPEANKPLDLSALKALNADGIIRIGNLQYGKTKASNVNIKLNANGEKLSLNPFSAKVDSSQIKANLGVSQFSNPVFNFDVDIDKLDADQYITKSEGDAKGSGDAPIDLSALKTLRATGVAKIGWLTIANVKTENVNIGLKADEGIVNVSPFSANLYRGNMSGSLKVDARATPNISFKQSMKSVAIGPLLVDAINNDMLSGSGTVNLDVNTQGNTVGALKKALQGTAALNLSDGAIKGVDIAGSIREIKSKVNIFKSGDTVDSDKTKKTDFSELTATFEIKNGVAHNEDLAMKAPILRLAKGDSKGDIDIGNEKINYLAKPTVVKSLKGQGGADLDELSGIAIPVKITGTFAAPKYGMDFAAIGSALAQSKLLDKVGGEKGAAMKELLGNDNKIDSLKNILGGKPKAETTAETAVPENKEVPKTNESKAEKKLKKLLNF